jgi:hypothetical protein
LQYMPGWDEVMRQWSILKIPYVESTPQLVGSVIELGCAKDRGSRC